MRLETERLVLRTPTMKDAKNIVELLDDRNISKFVASIPYPYGLKDARWFIKNSLEKSRKRKKSDYNFSIELKSEKRIVGGIGLHKIDKFSGTVEIGYWVGREYWKKGIVSEAIVVLLDFAFNKLKLNRVELRAYTENLASNNIAKKFGFKLEGTLKKCVRCKATNKIHDANIYGLLREEWKKYNKKLINQNL